MTDVTIGIDISKDYLDVHRLPDGATHRLANDKAGHRALIAWIKAACPDQPPARVVYEPTGAYHRTLEQALDKAGLPLVKINPRHARRFAEATGKLAKTDRADAAMLARMGCVLALEPHPVPSKTLGDLKALQLSRQALIKDQTAAKNRAKTLTLPLLKRQNARRLKQIATDLSRLDHAIETILTQDHSLARRFEILLSIPGIAKIAAFAILIDMPEIGTLDNKQAASLAGLAPIMRQSGRWNGRASIRGGRASLRSHLYMPALVAGRFNPDLKAKYDALIAAGKPAKIAITAIMRKLIILANALIRDDRVWTKNYACP